MIRKMGISISLRPPREERMAHLPYEAYEYVESIEGQSRPVRHTFDNDDEVGELETTTNGERPLE